MPRTRKPKATPKARPEKAPRKTISRSELARLAFCNSKRLPQVVELDGRRLQWVGIGWVNEGDPRGTEVLATEDDS